MIEWITIIALVLFGFGLIIIELLFVPGTTFVGIIGVIMAGFGIYYTYRVFGNNTGLLVLAGSVVAFIGLLIVSFKQGTWKKLTLKQSIESKVNEGMTISLHVGDEGVATSTIKPVGNAEFNGEIYEVTSQDEYIESGQKVKITQHKENTIIVTTIS